MRPRVPPVPAAVLLALCLAACGDGRRAELQIVVHARSVFMFGGRYQGITLSTRAVRWTLDLVETGGRACRLTDVVIVIHNPDYDDYTRAYTVADLLVAPEIPAFGVLHLDRPEWYSSENYVNPPRVPITNSLVLDVAARFRDGGAERISAVTVGPNMPLE